MRSDPRQDGYRASGFEHLWRSSGRPLRGTWVRCPLCRALLAHLAGRPLDGHPFGGRRGPGYVRPCDGSGRTLAEARELDALRQRAHP